MAHKLWQKLWQKYVEQSCVSKNDVIIISGANQIQTVFEPM